MTKQQMEMLVKLGVSKEEIAKLIIGKGNGAKTASSKPVFTAEFVGRDEGARGKNNPYVKYGAKKSQMIIFDKWTIENVTPKQYTEWYNKAK